ncbi:hypothetical protein SK128_003774 [Halocaridina rubra]|uniref:Uncharacterized protein n=1 Tax=Halocaridina rubra TaxID=373956 RepID=A0AAN8XBC8_HALRR
MKFPLITIFLMLTSRSHCWFFGSLSTDICDKLCKCPTDLHEVREKGLDCRDRNIQDLPDELAIPDTIAKVDFSRNHIGQLLDITFNTNNKILYLDFSDNDIEHLYDNVFQTVPNLKNLLLRNNKLKSISEKAFVGVTNLTSLDLSYNQLENLPSSAFESLTALEELILDFNPLVRPDLLLLANNSQLRSLSLSEVGIETLHPDFFPENLKKLEKLSLAHNDISFVPTKALFRIRESLKELDLSGNPIQTLGAYSFYGLSNVRSLRLDQMLKLETIEEFAFGDLRHLETCILRYMPRIVTIHPKAFRTANNKTEMIIPVEDFTFSFSILSTLPEKLLNWSTLQYADMKYNHWNCDCQMQWVKNSSLLEKVGSHMLCSKPIHLRGHSIINIPEKDFVCLAEEPETLTRHQ